MELATTATTAARPPSHPCLSPDPEFDLLLRCARTSPDNNARRRIESLLRERLDWDRFFQAACEQGVAPLVYTTLLPSRGDSIPDRTLNAFQAHFHRVATYGKLRTQELLRLLDTFQRHKIRAIAYKGPVLAQIAYGDLALREFLDIDILVPRKEIFRGREVLVAEGYRWCGHYPNPEDAESLGHHHAFSFVHEQIRCSVDLHWSLSEPPFDGVCLDTAEVLQRVEARELLGTKVLSVSREDLLLCLCFHASKHHWAQLKWLCDLAEFLKRNGDIAWETVWRRAENIGPGLYHALALNLTLASTVLGAELPPAAAERLSGNSFVAALGRKIGAKIASGERSSRYDVDALFLQLQDRFSARIRFFLKRAQQERLWRHIVRPTPGDYEWVSLPPWLSPLYYVIRPVRVLTVYGLGPLRWCVSLIVGRREAGSSGHSAP